MRALDCDFCGGTAAGAYEVVPDELDPGPDEQVRVVLCDGCRETLDGVLAPLLDRLGARDDAGVGPSFADATAGHAPPDPPTDATPTAGDDDAGAADPDPAADAAGHAPPSDEDAAADGDDDTAADPVTVGDAAADDTDTDDADDGTVTVSAPAREEPDGFRKVMRFLNNREFPVDRAEVSEFAAGAYDMDDDEVAAIFDYAVERGVLAEENGKLVKG
ncbi:hypothetical protein [Halobaculum lipolyticum]|uniref:Uncharacterized protein n=1 Tax=Halobaculum lipolyticum TaxID=3032001 RepID=A0ABD5WBT0_9EURY|nr:hypothetical protein [Halobaculum sp. DT31]